MWELDHKESWTPKNWYFRTVVLEKTWETLGQHRDQTSQSYRKSVLIIHWNNWCWSSNTLATWCKEPTHWKRPWCWERLKAGGEGDNKEWDWLHGITNSMDMSLSKLWEMVKDTMLQSTGSQRVGHNWAAERQQWTLVNSFWINGFLFWYIPTSGTDGSYGILDIEKLPYCFPVAAPTCISINSVQGVSFLYIFTSICYLYSFWW